MFNLKHILQDKDDAIAVATGGLSLPIQAREERKAAERDIERARRQERRIRDIQTARQRRQAIREARVQRAEIEAQGVASGASGSSSVQVGAGAVGTQLASNLSFLDQVRDLGTSASLFREAAVRHQSRAGDQQQLFDLGLSGIRALSGGA